MQNKKIFENLCDKLFNCCLKIFEVTNKNARTMFKCGLEVTIKDAYEGVRNVSFSEIFAYVRNK